MGPHLNPVQLDQFINKKLGKPKGNAVSSADRAAFGAQLSSHPNDTEFLVDLDDRVITCIESECFIDCAFTTDANGAIDFTSFKRHILNGGEESRKHALRRDQRIQRDRREALAQRAPLVLTDDNDQSSSSSARPPANDVKPAIGSGASSVAGPSSSTSKRLTNDVATPGSPSKKLKTDGAADRFGLGAPAVTRFELTLAALDRSRQALQASLEALDRQPSKWRPRDFDERRAKIQQQIEQLLADRARLQRADGEGHRPIAGPGPASLAERNPHVYAAATAQLEEERIRRAQQDAATRAARAAAFDGISNIAARLYGAGNAVVDAGRAAFDYLNRAPNADFAGDDFDFARRGYGGRQPRVAVHSAEMDEFFQAAAAEEMFEDNVTVDEAAKKLGLSSQHDTVENCRVRLMPHQLIGVAWMLAQENSKYYGGILGDEMGLGKTVQMIALMAKNESIDPKEKTTLVVAPLSLLRQWEREIEDKMEPNYFRTLIYHGSDPRKKDIRRIKDLRKYDVILTTYGTLVKDWEDEETVYTKARKAAAKAGPDADLEDHLKYTAEPGLLFKMNWYRVVLDEGHFTRNKTTKASRAVKELDALYRWVLTGTLIVNKHEDVFPLFRFLQLKPFFDWSYFKDHLVPAKNAQVEALQERSKRMNVVLKTCHMRRKKDSTLDGKPLLQLPTKTVELRELEFSAGEREIYKQVEDRAQVKFNKYLKAGTVLKNYAQVLALLLRLRQICFHPVLMAATHDPEHDAKQKAAEFDRAMALIGQAAVDKLKKVRLDKAIEQIEAAQAGDPDVEDCPVCFEAVSETEGGGVITRCGHVFCKACVDEILNREIDDTNDDDEGGPRLKANERRCPNCRGGISTESVFALAAFEPDQSQLRKLKPIISATDDDDGPDTHEDEDETLGGFIVDDELSSDNSDAPRSRRKGKGKVRNRRAIADSDEDEIDELDESESEAEAEEELSPAQKRVKDRRTKAEKAKADRQALEATKEWRSKQEPSTKMRWCMDEIKRVEKEDADDKMIIISQWTSVLDMMESYLFKNDIRCCRYQGDMSANERDKSLLKFMRGEKRKIMLLSLKCGGVGLNLVRANRVISLDLAWSPAVEAQAFDRVHRIGQLKEVQVDRLTIANSVEQRIGELQERKQLIADGSLGEGGGKKVGKLSVAEIAGLFGLTAEGERM